MKHRVNLLVSKWNEDSWLRPFFLSLFLLSLFALSIIRSLTSIIAFFGHFHLLPHPLPTMVSAVG